MIRILLTAMFTLFLFACGGGSDDTGNGGTTGLIYTGPTDQATIDENNADDLANSVVGSVDAKQASGDDNSISTVFGQVGQSLFLNRSSTQQVVGATRVVDGTCGGSYTAVYDSSNTGLDGSVDFNEYCVTIDTGDVIVDGAVSLSITSSPFLMEFEMLDLSITHAGETVLMNAELRITSSSFTMIVRYVGPDGQVHQIADYSISGDATSGYTISGSVYHPDYGYVTVTTIEPLVFSSECMEGPVSGQLTIEGANGSTATIEILGCGDYQTTVSQ